MTDGQTNVVAFEPRLKVVPPALRFVELRLVENCDLEMTLQDEAGNIVAVLAYSLAARTRDFDMNLLREAWERWRGGSAVAS